MRRTGQIGAMVILFALILSIMGGVIIFYSLEGKEEIEEDPVDTGTAKQQLQTLGHSFLSNLDTTDPEEIEEAMDKEVRNWISTSRISFKDHIATVLKVETMTSSSMLSLDIPVPPASLMDDTESLIQNSMLYGSSGAVPLLPSIRTSTSIEVLLEPVEGDGGSLTEQLQFETEVIDPQRGLQELISLIEKDMNGWGAGMARDMEYMLNTLARTRTKHYWGAGTMQSDLNVLGEGDIEIAFNIALAIRIMRWTGQVPEDLVGDIDRFFLDQEILPETNPTGLRVWGEAEKDNYKEIWRRAGDQLRRYLPGLLSSALSAGHADPADIFARYVFLDKWGMYDFGILDMESSIEDIGVVNERAPFNDHDPFSLQHHASFPDRDGIAISPRDNYNDVDNLTLQSFQPIIEPYEGYQILGRDIFIEGLDEPTSWFTDSNPNLKPSDLVSQGGLPVRCGAIPPPQKPPGHNYRVQWDLRIHGDIELNAESEGYGGNVLNMNSLWRTVSFDFPIRVHTWFDQRPNNDGYEFRNINTGRMYWTDMMTGWSITPESNATEVFEDSVFPDIREGLEVLTSQLRSMEWYIGIDLLDTGSIRKMLQAQAINSVDLLDVWSEDAVIWEDLSKFWNERIQQVGIQVEDLGTVRTEGHMISFQYSDIKDRLDLLSKLPEGEIRISFFGMKDGSNYIEAGLETSDGIRMDLRPGSGDFSIKGTLGGIYIDDGPLDPDSPSDGVSSLLIRSGWIARGSAYQIGTFTNAGQYIEMDSSARDDHLSFSFILAGSNQKDHQPAIIEISGGLMDPTTLGEGSISSYLHDLGDYAVRNDLWFGFSVAHSGNDGSHPFVRDILMRSNMIGTVDLTLSQGYLMELVRGALWGASVNIALDIDLESGGIMELMMIETVPSWVVPDPGDMGASQVLLVSYHSQEMRNDARLQQTGLNLFYYDESSYSFERKETGWSSRTIDLPSSLW